MQAAATSSTHFPSRFFIDGVFNANAIILMPTAESQATDEKQDGDVAMTGEKKTLPEIDKDKTADTNSNLSISPSGKHNGTIIGSIFCSTQDGNSSFKLKEDPSKAQTQTTIMYERWRKANNLLPQIDMKDIFEECPIFNNGKKSSPEHQHHPEFTQTSYLRIRMLEENFLMSDYLQFVAEGKDSLAVQQRIQNHGIDPTKINWDKIISPHDRSYGIQKIFDLHSKKDYKPESLFVAAAIFDRYIAAIGLLNFTKQSVVCLATISVLMSAKLEQPISPSFTRMINLLNDEEKKFVSKPELIDMEAQILTKFGFDFNFPGPIQTMERYLRILNYDLNQTIFDMSFQICKFQLNESSFLNFRPTMIAAASLILSINIYERDLERYQSKGFFKNCEIREGLMSLNTDIWNNQTVHTLSGYSILDIQACLYKLAIFISTNLQPNRLETFDVEAINSIKMYEGFQNVNVKIGQDS